MSRTPNVLFHRAIHSAWCPNLVLVSQLGALLLVLWATLIAAGCGAATATGQNGDSHNLTLSGKLPVGIANQNYNAVLSVSGGSAPYRFAVKSGNLPDGMTLHPATGSISGRPDAAGMYRFEVIVTDATLQDEGVQTFVMKVGKGHSAKVSVSPASVTLGAQQKQQFTATVSGSANTAVTWSASAGSIDASGLYTAPASPQTNIVVTAVSQANPQRTAEAIVTVNQGQPQPPTIVTGSLPQGQLGTSYRATFSATGGTQPYSWTIAAGNPPSGITLSSDGMFSGMPDIAGTSSFTVSLKDSTGLSAQRNFSLNIVSSPVNVSVSPASVTLAAKQTQQFTATVSGTSNTGVTWSASAGSIDIQGLYTAPSLIPQTKVTITASGKANPSVSAHALVTLEDNTTQPPIIANTSLPQGQVGSSYSTTLTASGGTQPYSWSISAGTPPAGVSLNSGGQLAGLPESAGTAGFTVSVKDTAGLSAQRDFSVEIVSGTSGSQTTCGPPTDPNYSCFQTSTAPVALPSPIPSWGQNSCDNTSPYTLQTCGNLTGAGTAHTPSDFNRPIVRLTDANTLSRISATPWQATFGTADNGESNLFASDDSWIIIKQSGQARYLMAFNPVTMAGTYSGITYANQTVIADHTSKSTVYQLTGPMKTQIYQDTLPVPLASCAPNCTQPSGSNHVLLYDFRNSSCLTNAYAGNPNWTKTNWTGMFTDTLDDTTFTVAFADQNTSGKGSYVASWKKSYGVNGGCDLWNTATGAILVHDGTHLASTNTDLFYNHEAFSALNNNYTIVSTSGPAQMIDGTYLPGFYIWQIGTSNVVHCGVAGGPYCDGHEGSGYLNLVAGNKTSIHTYVSPGANNPSTALLPVAACDDQHYSWNHDDSTDAYPVMSTYQEVGSIHDLLGGATPPCAYYDEIALVRTDGSGAARAAHTFNSGWHWQFEVQNAIGVESSSGKFAMWVSDGWGQFGSTNGTASCNVGGPDWHKSDSTHFTASAGVFGNYLLPHGGGNSGKYIYQASNCTANGGSGACATGATEPNFGSAQNSGQSVTEAAPGNITWVNTGKVSNCRSDILIVKLFD
jgi:Putative Ig domain